MQATLTANGSTPEFISHKPIIRASGTWGSGTLTLQYKASPSASWISSLDAVYTANVEKLAELPRDMICQLTLTGATDPNLVIDVTL